MPKMKLSKKDNFVTYHNLEKVPKKMSELLENYDFTSFEEYIRKEIGN